MVPAAIKKVTVFVAEVVLLRGKNSNSRWDLNTPGDTFVLFNFFYVVFFKYLDLVDISQT